MLFNKENYVASGKYKGPVIGQKGWHTIGLGTDILNIDAPAYQLWASVNHKGIRGAKPETLKLLVDNKLVTNWDSLEGKSLQNYLICRKGEIVRDGKWELKNAGENIDGLNTEEIAMWRRANDITSMEDVVSRTKKEEGLDYKKSLAKTKKIGLKLIKSGFWSIEPIGEWLDKILSSRCQLNKLEDIKMDMPMVVKGRIYGPACLKEQKDILIDKGSKIVAVTEEEFDLWISIRKTAPSPMELLSKVHTNADILWSLIKKDLVATWGNRNRDLIYINSFVAPLGEVIEGHGADIMVKNKIKGEEIPLDPVLYEVWVNSHPRESYKNVLSLVPEWAKDKKYRLHESIPELLKNGLISIY